MADWVTGKVTKVEYWTDALFSLYAAGACSSVYRRAIYQARAGNRRRTRAARLLLRQRPRQPDLEFYLVTVPEGKLSPRLAALKPGDDVQIVSDAAGFFVLDEIPDCDTLWMLATGTAIGPYLSILQYGKDLERFKNIVLVHAARYAADLSYLPQMQANWNSDMAGNS